jgi:hypothetical protein
VVNSLENDCENANTLAHGDIHMLVLAYLQRRWSLSSREGFGAFVGMKRLFSFVPEVRKGGKVAGVFLVEKDSSNTSCGSIRRWLQSHWTRPVANTGSA